MSSETPNPEIQQLQQRIERLESIINFFVRTTDYRFLRPIRGGANGLQINTLAAEKLSFYGSAPIVQWSSGTGRQDTHDNTGAAMNLGARFTGNTGTAYYSVGDIIAALKAYGLLQT